MTTFLSILLVFACLILVTAVLLQPAKSGVTALGGSSNSVFGSTGGTTFLFRLTMWTAGIIMAICLFLTWNKVHTGRQSFTDSAASSVPAAPLSNPTAPAAPLANPTAPTTAPGAPATAPAAPATPDKK